jgi:hypothetical protein
VIAIVAVTAITTTRTIAIGIATIVKNYNLLSGAGYALPTAIPSRTTVTSVAFGALMSAL